MDGTDQTSSPPYVPSRQPPNVLDPDSVTEGPTLSSGLWTYMYSAALHGTGGDAFLWVAGRITAGPDCDVTGPSNFTTCVPGIYFAQVSWVARMMQGAPLGGCGCGSARNP